MSDRESAPVEPNVVLCLVVKNEEKIIERCLRSVLPHVDGVVLCFNGTDSTVALAEALLLDHFKDSSRFLLIDQPWVNFGHNRTLSAVTAKQWVKEQHPEWPLDTTYLLFLDADMELRVESSKFFERRMLRKPGYKLIQVNHGEEYQNTRLTRLSHDWRSVSVTHEYWAPTPDFGEIPLLTGDPMRLEVTPKFGLMYIVDHDDGGSKSDKTARDIALLEQGLVDEPGNVRYMFYLARAYQDSGQHEKAVDLYRRRHDTGGWAEEVWYSKYREAMSLFALGKENEAIGTMLAAYQERPTRAEPLVTLAQHFRARGRSHAALLFARQASTLPYPTDSLFVWGDAHRHIPLQEIAISAFYTGDKEEGRAAAEQIRETREYASAHAHATLNLSFYLEPLAKIATRMGVFDIPEVVRKAPGPFLGGPDPNTVEYLPKNPTIVRIDEKIYVHVNLVNYVHRDGVVFAPQDPDGIVRTRGTMFEWDPATGKQGVQRMQSVDWPEAWDAGGQGLPHVRGLEDQRWFSYQGQIYLTATCFHPTGHPTVVFGKLDRHFNVTELRPLVYGRMLPCEKNWLPFMAIGREYGDPEELRFVYGFDPLVVLKPLNMTAGALIAESSWNPPRRNEWRGGAGPVSGMGGDLAIVHEVAFHTDAGGNVAQRIYMHRFVEIDREVEDGTWRITRKSRAFCLDHRGVEYATGLLYDKGNFIITYGSEEREARWMEVSWPEISRMMGPA